MPLRWLPAVVAALPGLPALAFDEVETVPVRVDRDACAQVVAHVASADVTYQPGIDAYGRPVAPADLPGQRQLDLPETITIDLSMDLADRFGFNPVAGAPLDPDARIGVIEVTGSRVTINGQPLTADDEVALAAACRRMGRVR